VKKWLGTVGENGDYSVPGSADNERCASRMAPNVPKLRFKGQFLSGILLTHRCLGGGG